MSDEALRLLERAEKIIGMELEPAPLHLRPEGKLTSAGVEVADWLKSARAFLAEPEPAACETCEGWDWYYFCDHPDSVPCPHPRICPNCGRVGGQVIAPSAAREAVLVEALRAADEAMEHFGNVLNAMDAVEEKDERYFPAFEKVRAALADTSPAAAVLLANQHSSEVCVPEALYAEANEKGRQAVAETAALAKAVTPLVDAIIGCDNEIVLELLRPYNAVAGEAIDNPSPAAAALLAKAQERDQLVIDLANVRADSHNPLTPSELKQLRDAKDVLTQGRSLRDFEDKILRLNEQAEGDYEFRVSVLAALAPGEEKE